jgi:hypothetical protein
MYWSLKEVKFTCPKCGAETSDDLQTHYMGEVGSCSNYYAIGEPVAELNGITVTLGKDGPDDLIGSCHECDTFLDFGARIEKGRVLEAWPELREAFHV